MTDRLWYKAWLETRTRFLSLLAFLTLLTVFTILEYPTVAALMPVARSIGGSGSLGRFLREAVELERDYRGYIWLQVFRQNFAQGVTLCAAVLGSGGLLHQRGGGALFTMSLPVSRARVVTVRAVTGLLELGTLAIGASLLIPILSPAVGQSYRLADAFVHGACVFGGAAVFYGVACWLSTVFADTWRPLLFTCGVALVLACVEFVLRETGASGLYGVMTGQRFFQTGHIPWLGLMVCASLATVTLWFAARSLEQQDF